MISCTVIISAYNNFSTLQRALWGYEAQTYHDFDIIIADDGSSADFRKSLQHFQGNSFLSIKHLWHPDEGFKKCKILNTAIKESRSDYLIFTDADIIPRNDFVASHLRLAHRKKFLAGGSQINIPVDIHNTLNPEDIRQQLPFNKSWLREHKLNSYKYISRLTSHGAIASLRDILSMRFNAFIGCNASAFRDDLLSVKGFDESFQYGSDDIDIGIRLANNGTYGWRHNYSLVTVHLDHTRDYCREDIILKQRMITKERHRKRIIYPTIGIE
jgi:GT2 family glycosyltransferase